MRRSLSIVVALLALCAAVQGVAIARATVAALDAARFAGMARMIDEQGLLATMRHEWEQPLYPAWLWAVHRTVGSVWPGTPAHWAWSVHLAAMLAMVLTVIPLFWLSRRMYGLPAATAGTFFFCLIPEAARQGLYGISDSLHLLWVAVALAALVRYLSGPHGRGGGAQAQDPNPRDIAEGVDRTPAFTPRNPGWVFLAGLATGVGLLVRAEIILLPAAWALTMCRLQMPPRMRRPWREVFWAIAFYAAGTGLVLGPYLLAVHATTPATAVARVLGRPEPTEARRVDAAATAAGAVGQLADGHAFAFSAKEPGPTTRHRGLLPALGLLGQELSRTFWYWIGLLGLYSVWRSRKVAPAPADTLAHTFLVLYAGVVLAFTAREGYLSARHLLPLLIAGLGSCGWGAIDLGRLLATRLAAVERRRGPLRWLARPATATALVVAIAGLACLAQTFRTAHAPAAAHRQAAAWLAAQPAPGAVVDTWGWTGLYSGRKTYMYIEGLKGFDDPRLAYVVLEPRELRSQSHRAQTLRRLLEKAGTPAAEFHGARPADLSVVVYRWDPRRWAGDGNKAGASDAGTVADLRAHGCGSL